MAYYLIVHQPGCSNVIEITGQYGGTAKRLFQGDRLRCEGYLKAVLDTGGEPYCGLNGKPIRSAICPPGDCLGQHWYEQEPPLTWSEDCCQWRGATPLARA